MASTATPNTFDPATRQVINSILKKLGFSDPKSYNDAAALKNLTKKAGALNTLDLTPDEVAAVNAAGFSYGKPATPATPDGAGNADKTVQRYRLPPKEGEAPRVEDMTAAKAAFRNSKRTDGREWILVEGVEPEQPAATPAAKPGKGKPAPAANAAPKSGAAQWDKILKDKKTTTEQKEKARTAKKAEQDKAAAAAKAEKTAAKEAKAAAKAAEPADKADKVDKGEAGSVPARSNRVGGAQLFKEMLEGGKELKKADVLEKLTTKGVKPGTAQSYVVWAKRGVNATRGSGDAAVKTNPFGFRIEEFEGKGGDKMLRRVQKK